MPANSRAMTSPLRPPCAVVDDERAIAAAWCGGSSATGAICVASYRHRGHRAAGERTYDLWSPTSRSGATRAGSPGERAPAPRGPRGDCDGAVGDDAVVVDALQRGADGYVLKPFDPEQVAHRGRGRSRTQDPPDGRSGRCDAGRRAGARGLGEVVNANERADPYRAGFSARTARLAGALGQTLGLDGERLVLAARVHDVGMLAVPATELHSGSGWPVRPST